MPRPEPIKVPLEEIRRTLEDLDRQRDRDRFRCVPEATRPRDEGGRELVDEATLQALREAPQEPVRVPLEEIRRTMYDLDRQHAEERAHRKGNRPRKVSELQPRGGKVILPPKEVAPRPQEVMESELRNEQLRVPFEEITRTTDDLDRQHAEETGCQRQAGHQQEASEPQTQEGKVLVPLQEISRTLTDLDRQHAQEAACRRQVTRPQKDTESRLRKGKALVPLEEVMRTIDGLDRQNAEETALRKEGRHPQRALEPRLRGGKVMLPPEEVTRSLSDVDRQHALETTRRRRAARPQEIVESELRNGKLRVPLEEVAGTLDGLDRQRAEQTAHRRQHGKALLPLGEIACTLDHLTRLRTEGSTPRGAGPRPQEVTEPHLQSAKLRVPLEEIARTSGDLDRQRAEDQSNQVHQASQVADVPELVRRPNTPEPAFPPPQTPPSRKRHSPRQEGLLTPPPSGPERSRKRPRLLQHETVQLQQRFVDAILQQRESCFRAKKDASVGKSWCKEVSPALQVETSKSFYEGFTDEWTLPISHCVFCYRKCPPAKITTIQWRTYLTPVLLQATTALQKCKKCLPQDGDMGVDICLECRGIFENGKMPKACSVNNMDIGCEHRYPRELDGLSLSRRD
ncbi:hypothetical protein BGZ61DRAFT_523798 [Ilyonectria robusta]|uniref:uncharacterized protein n=1 Tax=Ilyonectria robusta TaxID=1079257 RepID=UPI001E8E4EA1|nr:uncharacterized protein BGZ61DRAFT_523798 [Ilyonectria robusta]KAH8657272.1 hypothetical protein BGZ61DRAFT_523798 [Ilyonectria robusta]